MKRKTHTWINEPSSFSAIAFVPFTMIQATPVRECQTPLVLTNIYCLLRSITSPSIWIQQDKRKDLMFKPPGSVSKASAVEYHAICVPQSGFDSHLTGPAEPDRISRLGLLQFTSLSMSLSLAICLHHQFLAIARTFRGAAVKHFPNLGSCSWQWTGAGSRNSSRLQRLLRSPQIGHKKGNALPERFLSRPK